MPSKIHLPPFFPHPLQMAGVVEKIDDPGSIAMMEAVDGGCVLADVQRLSPSFTAFLVCFLLNVGQYLRHSVS